MRGALVAGVLTLAFAIAGSAAPAVAAVPWLEGEGSDQQTIHLDAGYYLADLYSNTTGADSAGVQIQLQDESGKVNEILRADGPLDRASSSIWVPSTRTVTLDVDAPDGVAWQVHFLPTAAPTQTSTGMGAVGARMQSPPVVRLQAGSYQLSLAYQNSRFLDGSAGLAAYVSGEHFDSFWLVTDEEDESADYSGAFLELTRPGNVWVTIAAAGADSTWTVRIDRALASATPTLSGTLAVGSTLKAHTGKWSAGTKLTYQWLANGKKIKGATKSTLKLTSSLKAKRISVKVTGKKTGYQAVSEASAATAKVAKAAKPRGKGTAKVGKTLKVTRGTWTKGTKFSYQWLSNGAKIAGATRSSLKLTNAHKGKKITVQVTGKKAGYATVTKTSKATKKVAGVKATVKPGNGYNCPAGYPVKGNASSMIYHMPGDRYYKATKPEECFRTASAAKAAGYRRAKV